MNVLETTQDLVEKVAYVVIAQPLWKITRQTMKTVQFLLTLPGFSEVCTSQFPLDTGLCKHPSFGRCQQNE